MDITKFIKRIVSRTEAAEDILRRDEVPDEEKDIVVGGLKKQNFIKYGFRSVLIPAFYMLYKNRFFDKPSRLFMREIGLVVGGVTYFTAADQLGSYLLWQDCGDLVKKYSNYSDNFYIDNESLKKMEEMYKMKKQNTPKTRQLESNEDTQLYTKDIDEDDEDDEDDDE